MSIGLENRVQIEFGFGRVNLQTTPMESEVDASRRDFELDKQPRRFELSTQDPRVEVDSAHVWEDFGHYHIVPLREQSAQAGMETASETTARIAQWGDQAQRIEEGGNPLIEQLEAYLWPDGEEFNVELVPSDFPSVNFVQGEAQLEYAPADINIQLEDVARRAYMERGTVQMDVDPEPYIDVRVE